MTSNFSFAITLRPVKFLVFGKTLNCEIIIFTNSQHAFLCKCYLRNNYFWLFSLLSLLLNVLGHFISVIIPLLLGAHKSPLPPLEHIFSCGICGISYATVGLPPQRPPGHANETSIEWTCILSSLPVIRPNSQPANINEKPKDTIPTYKIFYRTFSNETWVREFN